MTIGYGDLRKGMAIELDGEPYMVVGTTNEARCSSALLRCGSASERFAPAGCWTAVSQATMSSSRRQTWNARSAQYIYDEDDLCYFMDTESYDQFPLIKEQISEELNYLKEEMTVDLIFYEDNPISLELPITVDLQVVDSPPGLKGDTATGATKPATLETGLLIQVPLFVNEGEYVKVDTRNATYLSRV